MPVFHTKTIESILEPVAQQVSRLVILHEEAEDGNAMPDLERPVQAVSRAVANLVKVGRETIASSDDAILKQDMPSALHRVEGASRLLEEASGMLKVDPYSGPARKKLIEGSRGILQGTSSLLLCFDESEVRKIIRECKKVLDYLAVAEVIETMEDLAQFLKDLSPCLSKVSKEVSSREKELTHQAHASTLVRCLEEVKTLAPILICSMKIFIHIISQGGKGGEEAAENRNYLASRMTDEINEIIRVLQLTAPDEDDWDNADSLTVMKKALSSMQNRMRTARDWLEEPLAVRGGAGEKAVRQVTESGRVLAERALAADREALNRLVSEIDTMTDALCELRDSEPTSAQAESVSRSLEERLGSAVNVGRRAVINAERAGGTEQASQTLAGRMEQALRWLQHPENPAATAVGRAAVDLVVANGRKVAEGLQGRERVEMMSLCDQVERLGRQLSDLCARGMGNTPQAQQIARSLSEKLNLLKDMIQTAIVNRVVEDFMDCTTPLKLFTEAVHLPEGVVGRDTSVQERGAYLGEWSKRAVGTGRLVAAAGGNRRIVGALGDAAGRIESLTPQLLAAGRIRLHYPDSRAASDHYSNLNKQYADGIARVRDLCHEAVDPGKFVAVSLEHMERETAAAEAAAAAGDAERFVEKATLLARLADRVLQAARQEADNSEDPLFIEAVNRASDHLQSCVTRMVQDAKAVALNPLDQAAISKWRDSNRSLLSAVGDVRRALTSHLPDLNNLHINDPVYQLPVHTTPVYRQPEIDATPPPRPPLPGGEVAPPRPPPPPETDDEDEMFTKAPQPNQPIMIAAHGLHEEVKQWSSKDNEIIAAAKRMAVLMGRLSKLVRGEGGTKRDLIACAKAIADASGDVSRLARDLARECTDKRMRTNLLQVCERIPTIGTQLKILSTVKATMLGAQETLPRRELAELQGGSEEDQEATDMLVGNAQNLMQSVKETVRAAEAASIKIRTDAGIRLRWVRRQPWYQY